MLDAPSSKFKVYLGHREIKNAHKINIYINYNLIQKVLVRIITAVRSFKSNNMFIVWKYWRKTWLRLLWRIINILKFKVMDIPSRELEPWIKINFVQAPVNHVKKTHWTQIWCRLQKTFLYTKFWVMLFSPDKEPEILFIIIYYGFILNI